jgi:hypothetical protein
VVNSQNSVRIRKLKSKTTTYSRRVRNLSNDTKKHNKNLVRLILEFRFANALYNFTNFSISRFSARVWCLPPYMWKVKFFRSGIMLWRHPVWLYGLISTNISWRCLLNGESVTNRELFV